MNFNKIQLFKTKAYSLWCKSESSIEAMKKVLIKNRLLSYYSLIFSVFMILLYLQFPEKYGAIVALLCISFGVIGITQEAHHLGETKGATITFIICCAIIGGICTFLNSELYLVSFSEAKSFIYIKGGFWILFMYIFPVIFSLVFLVTFAFTYRELRKGEIFVLGILPVITLVALFSGYMQEMYAILGTLIVVFGYGVICHDAHQVFIKEYLLKVTSNHDNH